MTRRPPANQVANTRLPTCFSWNWWAPKRAPVCEKGEANSLSAKVEIGLRFAGSARVHDPHEAVQLAGHVVVLLVDHQRQLPPADRFGERHQRMRRLGERRMVVVAAERPRLR